MCIMCPTPNHGNSFQVPDLDVVSQVRQRMVTSNGLADCTLRRAIQHARSCCCCLGTCTEVVPSQMQDLVQVLTFYSSPSECPSELQSSPASLQLSLHNLGSSANLLRAYCMQSSRKRWEMVAPVLTPEKHPL